MMLAEGLTVGGRTCRLFGAENPGCILVQPSARHENATLEAEAQQIVDMATVEANNVRQSAMEYTFGQLSTLQDIIDHAIGTADAKYGDLIARLRECENIIAQDRSQLYPQVELDNDIAALEGYPTDSGKGGTDPEGGSKKVRVI